MPNAKIVVSCTTTTGMAEYRRRLPSRITKIYYPLDRAKFVRHALATINPEAVILLEAEIWPNFLWRARDLRVPVFLANARLSERSYPRYQKFGWLFRPLFASLAGVSCENETEAQKLRDVGCQPARAGGGQFVIRRRRPDREAQPGRARPAPPDRRARRRRPRRRQHHHGEELLLADMAARLREKFPISPPLLVPRHFERCQELSQKLKTKGVRVMLRSAIFADTQLAAGEVDCLLVNTTGELKFFYEPADIVFIGKTLTAIGGQNPLEPAALGKAVVFGPNMQNFKEITRLFLSRQAAVQVPDAAGLERALEDLLANLATRGTGRQGQGDRGRKPRRRRAHGGDDSAAFGGPDLRGAHELNRGAGPKFSSGRII